MSDIHEVDWGGRPLAIETGKLAGQAHGAVTVRYGDTVVLVTACMGEPREGIDFLPLTVDYEERLYAAGKIPGSFFRREGRPTQDATLVARLTDRPLRPLFPKGLRNEVQLVITVLSTDQENEPDILSIIGASTALSISDVPFAGPVSAAKVGYIEGQMILNPTFSQLADSLFEVVVVSTREAVVMLEAGAREAPEELILEAIKFGHQANQDIIGFQEGLKVAQGKPKREFKPFQVRPEVETAVASLLDGRLDREVIGQDRHQSEMNLALIKKELVGKLGATYPKEEILASLEARVKAGVRQHLLREKHRLDGRGFTQLRPISAEVGLLPRTHGSGLFTRGETQVLTITTLGSTREEQTIDGITPEESKRFMHHYNFPPFSTGEAKRIGGPGRREIGHGALVEKAITPVLPPEESFPYTIRLVSEVLSSSGSTSMASACASSLSLMDAGVPIKTPVGGVAIGLVTGEGGHYELLTDIEGREDFYGDMDFKVAGSTEGLTAVQMDIKLQGVSLEIIEKALYQGREARLQILDKMKEAIPATRTELSKYAPRMHKLTIPVSKIGALIGPGGKTIRSIIEETKTTIDVQNDGTVIVGSSNGEQAQKAIGIIEGLTREVEVGVVYTGKVTRLLNFGAMVEIFPGKEGLVHISELADYRVPQVSDVVKVGDEVMVKVTEVDPQGRVNLSRRAVFQDIAKVPGARVGDSLGREGEARRPSGPPSYNRPPVQRRPGPPRPRG